MNLLALTAFLLLLALLVTRALAEMRVNIGGGAMHASLSRLYPPSMVQGPVALGMEGMRRRHPVWALLGLALAVRLGTWLLAWLMFMVQENRIVGFWESFRDIWWRWDVTHYLNIADHGYVDGVMPEKLALVFYPLYPLLVAIVKLAGVPLFVAAVLVSLGAFCGAIVLLYKLVERDTGNAQLAWDSATALVIFPFSFFFTMPYTESTFLLLTVATFWYLRDGRWLAAGSFAALAGLTRTHGILLGLPFVIEIAVRWRQGRLSNPIRALLGLSLVPLGFIAYLGLNKYVSGDWFRFLAYQQQNWSQSFGYLPGNVAGAFDNLLHYEIRLALGTWLPTVVCYFAAIAVLLAAGRRMPLPYLGYAAVYILISYSPTWLLSGPRYLTSLFPLAIATGWLMQRNRYWHQGLELVMVLGLCFFLTLYLQYQVL